MNTIATLVGGLALFLYGISRTQSGLQRAAGSTLKKVLAFLTRRPIAAAGVGFGLTILTQSSSAVAVVLIGMVSSGLVAYAHSIAVLLGADVATTLTVQILAFEFETWALIVIAIGALFALGGRGRRMREAGEAVFGFGLLFFGMHLMKNAAAPLSANEQFTSTLAMMGAHPILGILAGLIGTSIIQSSGAMVGLTLALSQAGVLDLASAVPIVLGANVGTAATGMLASIGANREGRRLAITHVIEKVVGVTVVFPFIEPFCNLTTMATEWMGGTDARAVANAHTIFNVGKLFILLPFTGAMSRGMLRLMPQRPATTRNVIRFLADTKRDSPSLVLIKLWKEFGNAIDITRGALVRALRAFEDGSISDVEVLRRGDQEIDALYTEIVSHLRRIVLEELSTSEVAQAERLLLLIKDVESFGDSIAGRLAHAAEEKIRADGSFSMEGQIQFRELGAALTVGMERIAHALESDDLAGLERVTTDDEKLDIRVREIGCAQLHRSAAGVKEAVEMDAVFTNAVAEMRRMHGLIADMATILADEPVTEPGRSPTPPAE